jgi:hypothetical protein
MDIRNVNMTAEEEETLDWCYANLNEEQAAEIEEEAMAFASAEINAPEAAEKLLPLLVEIMVRNANQQGEEE